jgi:hypothetical protein
MQYLLLIHSEPTNLNATEQSQMMADYMAFTQNIIKSGNFKSGDRLDSSHTGATVRVRDGKTLRTDGPFAETKEQIGGYYIVEAASLDEAATIAAQIPGARLGSIEVRPITAMPPR